MKWTPDDYMLKGVRFLVERACAGLFWDPGLGKTSTMLAAYTMFKKQQVARGALVFCPLRVAYSVWPREIKKWDDFRHLSFGILHGPNKNDVLRQKHDLYVVNYEGLDWLYDQLMSMEEWPFDVLVLDESSKVKSMLTERYRLLRPLLKHFRRRYIMTGSPAPNGLLDLFGQVYAMDMGATFGPYFTNYRDEYFDKSGYGGYLYKVKKQADAKIYKKLAPRVLRMSEKDYLKLPRLIVRDVKVELPPSARKPYDQMENVLRAELEGAQVQAINAAVASGKCRQIAGGGVFYDEGVARRWKKIHDVKTEAVKDLVDELEGQPTMIIYEYTHELERLRKVFPDAVVATGVSMKRALEIEDDWNGGRIKELLVQPQSVSHGLNLQEAGRAQIWHTPTWNYELYDQMIRRMLRRGRKEPVFVYRVIAEDTVDEAVVEALSHKGRRQDALHLALRNYWMKRRV